MSHYVVEQHHRGVWKTIARRPTREAADRAIREIRSTIRRQPQAARLAERTGATRFRVRKVPD